MPILVRRLRGCPHQPDPDDPLFWEFHAVAPLVRTSLRDSPERGVQLHGLPTGSLTSPPPPPTSPDYVFIASLLKLCFSSGTFRRDGMVQYWDWPKYQDSPLTSPVFYGPYSLGNNGDYTVHNGTVITAPDGVSGGDIQLPAGVGGGYVTTGYVSRPSSPGSVVQTECTTVDRRTDATWIVQPNRPFTNMTVNLGPVDGTFGTEPGPDGGLGFNPRVLKRDLGPAMNQRYCNYTTVLSEYPFIYIFLYK